MSVIVFAMNSTMSHYFASFGIASYLKKKGHTILYFSANKKDEEGEVKKYRELVEARGFEFLQLDLENIIQRKENDYLKRKNVFFFNTDAFDDVFSIYKPDLIFLDAFLSEYTILLHKYSLPIILLQTMLCLDKAPFVPPISSHLIPVKRNMATFMKVEWEWFRLFCRRFFMELIGKIWFLGEDIGSQLKRVGRKNGFDFAQVYKKRPFTFGVKKYPEIILPAQVLDFKRPALPPNYYYVGPMIDMDRNDGSNQAFDKLMKDLQLAEFNRLVYCSLGTMAPEHNSHCIEFFNKVIGIFRDQPKDRLILSVGYLVDVNIFTDLPENVHVFNTLPQVQVLKKAHLMLTAAGINSISECVLSGVPMIVFPLNGDFDQNGNAARVVYHGLGVRGDLTDTIAQLHGAIKYVCENKDISRNIKQMQAVLMKNNASPDKFNIVEILVANYRKGLPQQEQI